MKKSISTTLLVVLSLLGIAAQEPTKVEVKLYGFIRNDMFVDSYKGINSTADQYYLFPLYAGEDAKGNHLNQQWSGNLVSMSTRFGLKISGPTIFNAASSALIETDFSGSPSTLTALLRLRQAYVKLNWENSHLLAGQTWHPLWGGSVYPTVASLNTGAPFQPFNRSPQIRYDHKTGSISFNASAVYEFQYLSNGPAGKSDQYLRNAVIPELVLGTEFKKGDVTLGLSASYKQIKPRLYNEVFENDVVTKYISKDLLTSTTLVGFAKYKSKNFSFMLKSVYGQNLGYLVMPSGYGVSSYNVSTGKTSYTNYNNSYSFMNAVYGDKWQLGIFAGYGINLGTTDALHNFNEYLSSTREIKTEVYGLLPNIQSVQRFSTLLTHNAGKIKLCLEYELTKAEYGSGDVNLADGLYGKSVNAVNNRVLISMIYFF